MGSDTSLIFNLLARDKASKTLGKVEGKLNKMGVAIVGLAAGAAVGLAKVGGDFHEAFSTIRVGTGATGDQLAGLEQSFKNVASTVPDAIGDTATVLADFNTLTGATGTDLEGLTQTYLNLERITGESVGPEKITRVFGDWGVATKDQASTMDELFRVSQTTGVGVGDLAGKVVQFGAPLRGLGFDLEQGAALLGKWHKEGVNTETVMAGLRTASGKWAKEGKALPATLQETIAAIQGAGSEAEAQQIALENFGTRAGPDMAAAILEGRFEIDELMATLAGNEDTVNGLADETEGWQEKLAKLKNEGLVAIEPIASTVFGLLNDGVPILRSVGQWMQNNAGTVKILAIALGSIAAAILLLNVGLKIYHGVMMVVRTATLIWTGVQWLLNTAFLGFPLFWIIAAVLAVVAIVFLLVKHWDTVTAALGVAWEFIKDTAITVWNAIKDFFIGLWDTITGFIGKAIDKVKDIFFRFHPLGIIIANWGGIVDWVKGMWDKVIGFVKGIPGRVKSGLSNLRSMLMAPFKAAFNGVSSLWNRTLGQVSFTVPTWVPGVGGRGWSFPNMPTLAQGGIAHAPTMAMIGEGGRSEAVVPLPPGVRDLRDLMRERDRGPDEFVATATIDLGEGVQRVIDIKFQRKDRELKRRVRQGSGAFA
jgi:phage-related minor tail protein